MKNYVTPTTFPPELRLAGVPRIGFDIHFSPFPGALYAVFDYLGDH